MMRKRKKERIAVNDVKGIHSDLNKIIYNRNLVYVRPIAASVDYIRLVSNALHCLAIDHEVTHVNIEVNEYDVTSDIAIILFDSPLLSGLDRIAEDEQVRYIGAIKGHNKNLAYINRVRLN